MSNLEMNEEIFSKTENGQTEKLTQLDDDDIDYTKLDADKVLSAFGKYGRYQMMVYVLTSVVWGLFASEVMIMAFITIAPPFSCSVDNKYSETYEVIDECTIKNEANETFSCGRKHTAGTNIVFNDTTEIGKTLATEFDLVCSDAYLAQMGTSIFMIGGLVVPITTQFADRYGRRWTYTLPIWFAVFLNMSCSLAPSNVVFLILRFFTGVANTCLGIGYILCCESVSKEFRDIIPLVGNTFWVAGYILVGVAAKFIHNWRWLYFALNTPALLTLSYYWLIPESLHWMVTQKKARGIKAYIDKASKFNNVQLNLNECMVDEKPQDKVVVEAPKRTFLDVIKCPILVYFLILYVFIHFANSTTYWGLSLFSVELSEDRFTGYVLSGLVELPAGFLAILLLQWFPRKIIAFSSTALQGCLMLSSIFLKVQSWPAMVVSLLSKMANTVVWSVLGLMEPEMVPTTVRGIFHGISMFLEVGSIVAPYIGLLKNVDVRLPALLLGSLSVMAAFCTLLFPETKGQPLPEDLDDLDPGPVWKWFSSKKSRTNK